MCLLPGINEKQVQNALIKELKVRQIERALENSLDEIEQDIIRKKYLTSRTVNDLEVCEELGLKKDRYYKLKKQATFKLSPALGISIDTTGRELLFGLIIRQIKIQKFCRSHIQVMGNLKK
ncbi:ArpU family phage packaging/lysis transcriptional regulator [Bacillus safensis]|uniref:ArpU family phage packaging/lysis transcriptional regulator n=1 Tax=Bacillus safensis TaxID=561879 RepID=UPI0037FEE4D5